MKNIYNELRRHEGKLTDFARHLVDKGFYSNEKIAIASLRNCVKEREDINAIYEEWKPGKLKTKDMQKHKEKVAQVFKEIKRNSLKQELCDIRDTIEEALMELTLAIKNNNVNKLPTIKTMLQNALYGGN